MECWLGWALLSRSATSVHPGFSQLLGTVWRLTALKVLPRLSLARLLASACCRLALAHLVSAFPLLAKAPTLPLTACVKAGLWNGSRTC